MNNHRSTFGSAARRVLPPFVAILALASPLSAVTYTWTSGAGAANPDRGWGSSSNWAGNPTLSFNNTTDIIFDESSIINSGNFSFTGGRTIRSLTFNADFLGAPGTSYEIRTRNSAGGAAVNLTFSADSGNASITVAQSTTGIGQIRIGDNAGGTVLGSNLDLAQNNTNLTLSPAFQFNNVVSGSGTINKTGAGRVTFVRANTWSGGLNINEGEVQVWNDPTAMGTGLWTLGGGANNTTFGVGSTVTQSNTGGLLVEAGGGTRTISLIDHTVGNPTMAGAMTLNKDVIFDITQYTANTHDRITNSGAVSGSGGIIKAGTGVLILSNAANSFGGLQINAGQVTMQTNATVTGLSGSGGGLALSGGTLTVNASADSSFGQVISGAGNLVKSGNGTLTLSAPNTHSGGITLSAGTLRAGNDGSLGAGAFTINAGTFASDGATARSLTNAITLGGNVQLGDGTGTGALTLGSVNLGGASRTMTVGNTTTFSGAVTNGGLTKAGAGTLHLSNAATSFGALQIDAGRVAVQTNATITGLSGTGGDLALVGGTLTVNTSADSSFGQVISGAGSLAKSGAGTLVLSGANSYSGGTTLSAGVLRLGNDSALGTGTLALTASATLTSDGATARAIANAVTLGSGTGNVALASGDATGTGALTLSGPVTLGGTTGSRIFTVNNAPMTVSGLISSGTSSGAVVKNGTGTLVLANTANTFTNNVSLQAGTLQVTKLSDKGTASSIGTMQGASFLQIGQTASSAVLNYTGTGDTTDLQVSIGNGAGNGGASILNNGSGVLIFSNAAFNVGSGADTTANARNLALGGTNTGANEIRGVIADITALNKTTRVVKNDSGTWILSGANTYTVGTTLNAGTLRVGNDNALGTGALTINDGTLFAADGLTARTIGNAITLNGNVQLGDGTNSGGGALTLSGSLDLGAATRTLTISNNGTTVSGAVTGSGGLTKQGDGLMTLSGNNAYNGATTISTGVLRVGSTSALGSTNGGTVVASGAQLRLFGVAGVVGAGEALQISGDGGGAIGALRSGSGETNTFGGKVTLAANATINAGAGTGLILDVASGDAVDLGVNTLTFVGSGTHAVNDAIIGTGGIIKTGSGTMTVSGASSYTGATTISNGVLKAGAEAGGQAFGNLSAVVVASAPENQTALDLNNFDQTIGSLAGGGLGGNNQGVLLGSGTLTTGGNNASTTYNGRISGTGGLIKEGTGAFTLTASNAYSGGTWLNGGELIAGHVNAFGSGAITVGSGTTLNFSNFSVGNSVINNGGSILGTGTLNNVDAEAGTTTIGGANSTITQIGGTATVNVNAANATVAAMSAGTLNINAAGAVVTNLSGGNIAVSNGLSVALRSGSSSGVISGAGGVAKQGSGTLTLAGNNTYSGATAVEAGKLVVNGAITNSTVNVQSGATLGGSGAVGSTTLLSGSAIAPGNSPGSITNIGNLTWSGGSSYQWEIFNAIGTPGTDWDLIEVTGQLLFANISSTNRFSIDIFSLSGLHATAGPLAGWNPLANTNWTILSAAGGISGFDPNNFTLNLANFTNNNSLNGGLFSLATEGNNLKLFFEAGENPGPEPIPEPGTWAAAALLALAALYARRRRAQPSARSSQ